MKTAKLVFLFFILVVSALSLVFVFGNRIPVDFPPQKLDERSVEETSTSWTVDLSVVHIGTIDFVFGEGDEWHPDSYFRDMQLGRATGEPCEVRYNPAIFGKPLVETADPTEVYFDFAFSLINCGLSLPENDDLRERFEANFQWQTYDTWIREYIASCGKSTFRLGWKSDPETDTDLICVPDWREIIERHLEGKDDSAQERLRVQLTRNESGYLYQKTP